MGQRDRGDGRRVAEFAHAMNIRGDRGMFAMIAWLFGGGFCAGYLDGCAVDRVAADTQRAATLARASGLQLSSIVTATFTITVFARIATADQPLHVYFEGDGHAWDSRSLPAADPTPHHALGLQLATRDPAANVVYIARPCQFQPHDRACSVTYWTDRRYCEEIVAAIDEVVSHFAAQVATAAAASTGPFEFIGYSGGGAIAVLIAARRHDVRSLRTVAGNLDTDEVMRLHGVDPLRMSLNPISVARAVSRIPQIHFSGGADRVVPPAIAARFVAAEGVSCAHTQVLIGLSHEGRWSDLWPALLAQPVACPEPPSKPY